MPIKFTRIKVLETVIATAHAAIQQDDGALSSWIVEQLPRQLPRRIEYLPWRFNRLQPLQGRDITLRLDPDQHVELMERSKKDLVTFAQLVCSLVTRTSQSVQKLFAEERAADKAAKTTRARDKAKQSQAVVRAFLKADAHEGKGFARKGSYDVYDPAVDGPLLSLGPIDD